MLVSMFTLFGAAAYAEQDFIEAARITAPVF
jgi:hypothetical protein